MDLTFGDVLVYVTVFFGLFTSIFFLLTLLEHAPKEPRRRLRRYEKVCIVVPCYNEERTVAKTLESLLALDYPKKYLQIIVVDDGSTDETYRIAKRYARRGVEVYRKHNGGKYTALNYALKRTDAMFVGALDADSFVHPKALRRMIPYFNDQRVMAVTPSMKVYRPKRYLQHVQWTEYLLGILLRKMQAFLGAIHVTPGPLSIYRRSFFLKHGYYRHAYNTEDIEMALRIQANNYEIENAHDAYVYTVGPSTFKTLWNQRLRWYYGFIRNLEDYKQLFSVRHGVLGTFFLPAAFFSVALVLTGMAYMIYRTITQAWDKFVYLRATGFDPQLDLRFDTFFISMNGVVVLGLMALLIGILLLLVARSLAGERGEPGFVRHYVWFAILYWFLYGLWWLAAFYMRLRGRSVAWGHKSKTGGT